jgi:hypothetical protein
VATQVFLTPVSLGFHNDPGQPVPILYAYQPGSEQVSGYLQGGSRVEGAFDPAGFWHANIVQWEQEMENSMMLIPAQNTWRQP